MSDLYLDTEINAGDLMFISGRLASTELSIDELDRIFYEEVHPVCCWNLVVVAGVWDGFDKEWLKQRILARQQPRTWLKRLRTGLATKITNRLKNVVRCDWEKTKLLLELKRNGKLK